MNAAVLVLLWFNATKTVLQWYKDAFQRKLLSPFASLFSGPFRSIAAFSHVALLTVYIHNWQNGANEGL